MKLSLETFATATSAIPIEIDVPFPVSKIQTDGLLTVRLAALASLVAWRSIDHPTGDVLASAESARPLKNDVQLENRRIGGVEGARIQTRADIPVVSRCIIEGSTARRIIKRIGARSIRKGTIVANNADIGILRALSTLKRLNSRLFRGILGS